MTLKRIGYPLLLALMLSAGLGGLVLLTDYAYRPSAPGEMIALRWPETLAADAPKNQCIVLFYHPHCPCTRATAATLTRLQTQLPPSTAIIAYAYCPKEESDAWIESSTTARLRDDMQAVIHIDRDAQVCRNFGVATSGHILAYDEAGELVFRGGITPSRGHEGICAGAETLCRCLRHDVVGLKTWPVFGCRIATGLGGS